MGNFWIEMALAIIFSVLKQVVKNPASKADLKRAMLKLHNSIKLAYANDPDFA